ncbi:unnamed protein product [Acanthoscelides obtectus]|uniref:Uncharacterized protein n=1 Tax=Acanthoscelides obtectus TaxID=200917 RepID=A0A9P0JYV4_ACAOB|nr:unnamed protein product [Acanthoscelides obtectus]CAK1648704.1 hypothetical protein AOBTE_LOCUS15830 [Acanthoscelides obtectus]
MQPTLVCERLFGGPLLPTSCVLERVADALKISLCSATPMVPRLDLFTYFIWR